MSSYTVSVSRLSEDPYMFNFILSIQDLKNVDGELNFDREGLACTGNIKWAGNRLKLTGNYLVNFSKPCDCCLKKAKATSGGSFELYLMPAVEDMETEDREIFMSEPDIDYFENDVIDLADYFESQLYLDMPERFICSEKCLGLCPLCGTNKNIHMCDCEKKTGNFPFQLLFN